MAQLREILTEGAQSLGLALDDGQLDQLLLLTGELLEWNTRINLTAIRDPHEVVRKHMLDSLSIHTALRGREVVDVGSGAGFPGLPLAIAESQRHFTMIESIAKKARFIEHAIARLGLANATVVNARSEGWKPPRRFDTVVARALSSLADFVKVAGHLCAPDGVLLAMKGRYPEDEIAALPRGWKVVEARRLTVPGLDAERHLIVIQGASGPRRSG